RRISASSSRRSCSAMTCPYCATPQLQTRRVTSRAGGLYARSFRRRYAMADEKLTLTLDTGNGQTGDVVIKLRPDLAPGHVERISELAREGFYDGVVFHRVIPGFMAEGGDPTGTGMSGSDKPDLKAEFNSEPHVRGTCSMARTQVPDSANSQFFICFDDARFLDKQYTV